MPARKTAAALVALIAFLAWLPILGIGFVNDDYQIVGWHSAGSFSECLKPFISPDVSGYYWRPLGNSLHALTLWFAGFSPLPFRLTNLLLYIICCILVAGTGRKAGLNDRAAFFAGIIFAVLPSHELPVAWIAGRGETMTAIFLLLAAYFYMDGKEKQSRRDLLASGIFFLLALLTKELAFAGALLPFILAKDRSQKEVRYAVRASAVAFLLLAAVLGYRFVVIGGSPFASPHFAGAEPAGWLGNFVLYLPVAFLSPDMLEQAAHAAIQHKIAFAALAISCLGLLIFYRRSLLPGRENRLLILRCLAWFIIFILPALPTFMRWYVFTASIGLVWISGLALDRLVSGKTAYAVFLGVALIFLAWDFGTMLAWQRASRIMDRALASLRHYKSAGISPLYLYGIPDKAERIAVMKIGTQEAVQWALNDKKIDVRAPLRLEAAQLSGTQLSQHGDTLLFTTRNGRFLPQGGRSRAVIRQEEIEQRMEGQDIRIRTEADGQRSQAQLFPKRKELSLYFNGQDFMPVR